MFNKEKLAYAVDLQKKAYELLMWTNSALKDGVISFKAMHQYASISDSAQDWVTRHYENIPAKARPEQDDIPAFCEMFSTFLQNSFDLIEKPGKNLFSTDAHCFCPLCSWLVNAPHLKTKKVQPQDRKRADKLMKNEVMQKALEQSVTLDEKLVDKLLDDRNLVTSIALCAYGTDLLRRLNGVATGPAVLELWRRFAWTPTRSPQKGFKLSADLIMDAEKLLVSKLLETGQMSVY